MKREKNGRIPRAPRQNATIQEKIAWLRKHHPTSIRNVHAATNALIAYVRYRTR